MLKIRSRSSGYGVRRSHLEIHPWTPPFVLHNLNSSTDLFSRFWQIQNAQAAGAAAVLIVNTDAFPPGYFSMSGGTAAGSVNIPAGSLPKAVGTILYAALKGKTAVQLSFAVVRIWI